MGLSVLLLASELAAGAEGQAALPITPIKALLESESEAQNQQVKVAGTVTVVQSTGASLFLQDETAGIYAECSTHSPARLGDLIEVVGTVQRSGYSKTLAQCSYRILGRGQPVTPRAASGKEMKSGALDMQLVQVRGPLVADPILRTDAQVLEMKVDEEGVSLILTDFAGSALSQLRPRSLLQVTGVCNVRPDNQRRPAWVRIYLRSGDDVVVLRGPPWWTHERTSAVLGLVAAIGLAGMGWMAMVRHKSLSRALEQRVRAGTAELRDRTAELERVNRELETFSYSVSHDLRAPLRAMAGFSQALVEDYDQVLDTTGKSYLKRINDAAAQMNRLIDGLLSLARVTRSDLRRETTDLSEIAAAVVEELKQSHPGLTVAVQIQPGMVESVDRNLIRIVFSNLLQNAWKFTRKTAEPKVEVGRLAGGKATVYYVRDNGAGFDPSHSQRLFQAFQRLHSTAEYEGTGIGLATVQKIVEHHRGRIWAEGKPNQGACFFFTVTADAETKAARSGTA